MSYRLFLPLGALACVLSVSTASAQEAKAQDKSAQPKPVLSPRDSVRANVGSASVLIDYGRPSKRNREIFGGLVPYDKVWRTGANAATTLVTDKPIKIDGKTIPAGTHTIYTIPGKTAWTLIINKQTGQWGTVYKEDQDLVRIPMSVATLSAPVEKFAISIDGGKLHMQWDTTDASVPISE